MRASLCETALTPRLVILTLGGDRILSGWGTNCVAFASPAGTVLVDPLIAPAHARLVDAVLRRRGFPEVRHVVLTHHHTDHALGASWFAARGAEVIAHVRCAADMAVQHPATVAARRRDPALAPLFADAEPFVPAIRFEERHVLKLGAEEVEVRHLGPGHTPGDAVVLFPSEGAVACGDLIFAGYHFNYEEAAPAELPRRLAELAALPAARFVPGHGPSGGRELLDEQARYHAEVARIVRAAANAVAARTAIEARFRGRLLPEAIASAIAAFGGGEPARWG
ncbi:MAG TPA: MBL fold metallo-hydrolase [Anaeromyxobacter sp.]|jgi:glyoxylase-like metal-dependent hydrolase (beta-lactamase superfamily II)|nr:MBL fold metallo-hydrolase [Anaeromyxobacter sp.]